MGHINTKREPYMPNQFATVFLPGKHTTLGRTESKIAMKLEPATVLLANRKLGGKSRRGTELD